MVFFFSDHENDNIKLNVTTCLFPKRRACIFVFVFVFPFYLQSGAVTSLFPEGFLTPSSGAKSSRLGKTFQCQSYKYKRKKVGKFQSNLNINGQKS